MVVSFLNRVAVEMVVSFLNRVAVEMVVSFPKGVAVEMVVSFAKGAHVAGEHAMALACAPATASKRVMAVGGVRVCVTEQEEACSNGQR